MRILNFLPNRSFNITSPWDSVQLDMTSDLRFHSRNIRIVLFHGARLVAMELFSIEMWDRAIEVISLHILFDLPMIYFVVADWWLSHIHFVGISMLRLSGAFVLGWFFYAQVVFGRRGTLAVILMCISLLVILEYFIGDVSPHFGEHGCLGECVLQLLLHGRIDKNKIKPDGINMN